MNDYLKKYQDLIILAALLAVSVSMFLSAAKGKKTLNFLERALMTATSPFQDAIGWTAESVSGVWRDYIFLVGVREDNQRLRRTLDKLAFENALILERLKSYQRLDDLLTFPSLDNVSFEAARVIGRDPSNRVRMITLNKGSRSGVGENMPVVTHRGIVGRTVSVSATQTKVLLITDVRSAVDGIAQETRDSLVAAGDNSPELEVKYLSFGAQVKEGDMVISSGLGGVFPKGLLTGTLHEIKQSSGSLFLTARLRPVEDFSRLEEALILKGPLPVNVPGEEEAK
ncbi:MAG: rod shape-determining protein MreC [Nitrospinae bacterium]|nr:rod shape-determining protein MreC [Nitrospinota bacterium]